MSAPGQSEAEIQAAIRLALGQIPALRLWRNNSGVLFDRTGRPVRYGVGSPGGSDLIGIKQVTVTAEHVGRTLAVFTAIEVKTPAGAVKAAQQHFVDFVRGFGGVAGVVRSVDDALRLVLS